MALVGLYVIVRDGVRWRAWHGKLVVHGLGFALGTAALLLAPGNAVRRQIFIKWNKLGWDDRILLHFTERVPLALHHLGLLLLTALVLLLIAQRLRTAPARPHGALSWLFMLAAVVSLSVMVASPCCRNARSRARRCTCCWPSVHCCSRGKRKGARTA